MSCFFWKKDLLLPEASLTAARTTVPEADPDSEDEKLSEVTQEVWSGVVDAVVALLGSQWDCQTWHGWKTIMDKGSVKGCL